MALHCTECGFVNGEGANYCQRCGALLPREEHFVDSVHLNETAQEMTGRYVAGELAPLLIGAGGARVSPADSADRTAQR